MSVVVIGKSSFMAQAVKEKAPATWRFFSHQEALAQRDWLADTRCVINFAFSPHLRSVGYELGEDIDTKIAHMIGDAPIHYIMLSSRMVYGLPASDGVMRETDATRPINSYGASKLRVEQSLHNLLGEDRLTILRLANIFGIEHGRRSFFGMAQGNLVAHNRIIYDMSPLVKRDFMAVWRLADVLVAIASAPKAGVYHVGSGLGIETGLIAEWLIEGYGQGELLVNNLSHTDQFWLNMEKTRNTYAIPAITRDDVRSDVLRCGAALQSLKKAV